MILQKTANFFIYLSFFPFFLSFRCTALALANPGIYTYLILWCSFFLPPSLVFFVLCFFVLPSLTTCHPLYIPPLFAVLSPFSTEFIHAFHCFLSISHPNAFIMPRSFVKTPLTISLTSGRGRLAEVKTTRRSIKELPAISAFIQARIRSPLTKCKKYRGCARRPWLFSYPARTSAMTARVFTCPSAGKLWLPYSMTLY